MESRRNLSKEYYIDKFREKGISLSVAKEKSLETLRNRGSREANDELKVFEEAVDYFIMPSENDFSIKPSQSCSLFLTLSDCLLVILAILILVDAFFFNNISWHGPLMIAFIVIMIADLFLKCMLHAMDIVFSKLNFINKNIEKNNNN